MAVSAQIYYFSGTGNSLVVARDIAGIIDARLTSIPSVMHSECVETDAEAIGIVFPVYHAIFDGIPLKVERFVGKMDGIGEKYIFAVCTCRGWSRLTISRLGEIIASRGGRLRAGFTVPMPDNTDPVTPEKQRKIFTNWNRKLEVVSKYVNARNEGRLENTTLYNVIMAPLQKPLEKKTYKLLAGQAGSQDLPYDRLLPLTDRSFAADENCNGCGICARVCPVSDIEMIGERPVWQNRCESCLACVNWCPERAIHGGILTGKRPARYRHPDVGISDILLR